MSVWHRFISRGEEVDRRKAAQILCAFARKVSRRWQHMWDTFGEFVLAGVIRVKADFAVELRQVHEKPSYTIDLVGFKPLSKVDCFSTVEEHDRIFRLYKNLILEHIQIRFDHIC